MYQPGRERLRDSVTLSPSPTLTTALPDPRAWATAFIRAVGETWSGRRPSSALTAATTGEVREILHRRPLPGQRAPRHITRPLQPGRVHTRRLTDDVVEANAVLLGPDGGRAVAFRIAARGGRWICVALETQRPVHLGTRPHP
jgi:hypothetical protein